ncbi:hypothetical protein EON65_58805 [archaeon]|nr:MAG: hypothetical protein EON65_58805 [archaeon]
MSTLSAPPTPGVSPLLHFIILYSPPLLMLLSAGLGAFLGDTLSTNTLFYISLVAFGTVVLLYLVCTELLIEAKQAVGEEDRWYITAMIFLGIYVVLVLDLVL